MNTSQINLNTELFSALEVISHDENMMRRAVNYLKNLAGIDCSDELKMAREDYFKMLDEAENGETMMFENIEELDKSIRGNEI